VATSRVGWFWSACIAGAVGIVGACAEGTDVESTGADEAGTQGVGGAPGAAACSGSMPCPPGSICHNGACAAGCNVDADCAADQVCALEAGQICQPRELPSCPAEAACTDTQVCVDGLCGVQTGAACGPNPFGTGDGCPDDQICLTQAGVDGTIIDTRQCYALPGCSPQHTCPIGPSGAVCSAGIMADKLALCLPGLCLGPEHCPDGFVGCVRASATDTFGHCTDGAAGSLCKTTADCGTGTCTTDMPGLLGRCGGTGS
jgi:hypothetical protein